ncbi:hypothetical protein [Kitasatospora viridis]|uniref:Uncharacterized protein n=1 Tax=Kitasatospora viridis TaxID=281105 RepID=A0A561TV03_9ACTN|nr:hypothetical protein [Kitasatospora viridis]TWF90935.1 hypothetical protein FHX73_1247 [Kitasatospora viridis]
MEPLLIRRDAPSRYGAAGAALVGVGLLPGALVVAAGGGVAGVLLLGAGVATAVRAERAMVHADQDGILVRGSLRSRRIALADVVGMRAERLYFCDRRGRLRSCWLSALGRNTSRWAVYSYSNRLSLLQRIELERWIEEAVTSRIKRRARLLDTLDDAALAREARVAAAGERWERKYGVARPRWHFVSAAAERVTGARAAAGS